MSFIAPLALLSGLLGGIIVVMYLLKLKRKKEIFSSTLLWTRSMEDMTANAPFQKLRQNLLMYLQVLLLLLLAFSLARPTMWLNMTKGTSVIVLLDNSASMNALDVAPSRLDAAKAAAQNLVDNMQVGDQMMIVSIGGRATVVQPFTQEKGLLSGAIRRVEPTDADAKILDALNIVKGVRKVEANTIVKIVSDGGLGYLGNMITEKDPVEFVKIGADGVLASDNRGITAFDVRESFEKRGEAQAFAEIENFAPTATKVLVRCLLDGELAQVKELELASKEKKGVAFTGLDGTRKRIRIELDQPDQLEVDNAVEGFISLDSSLNVLLVTNGNFFLERLLALIGNANITKVAPNGFDPTVGRDLIIFDQFAPAELGPGSYLFLNASPPLDGFVRAPEPIKSQMALDWNRLHPVTRFASFDSLAVSESLKIDHPSWVTALVEAEGGDLIMAGDRQGIRLVCVAFDIYSTDWPLQIGFPIFMSNAIQWLSAGKGGDIATGHRAGETITITGRAGDATPIEVADPSGDRWPIERNELGIGFFNATDKAGVYSIHQGESLAGQFAVNLLSPTESNIMPQLVLVSGEQSISASVVTRQNREIWHWFALLGIAILVIEWHVYCRRSWL